MDEFGVAKCQLRQPEIREPPTRHHATHRVALRGSVLRVSLGWARLLKSRCASGCSFTHTHITHITHHKSLLSHTRSLPWYSYSSSFSSRRYLYLFRSSSSKRITNIYHLLPSSLIFTHLQSQFRQQSIFPNSSVFTFASSLVTFRHQISSGLIFRLFD
jgi:hypothetical protein